MKHILIADDEPIKRTFMQTILAKENYMVGTCRGKEIIPKMAEIKYDLIISTGEIFEKIIDFTAWMQLSEKYAKVPVIILVNDSTNIGSYSELTQRKVNHSLLIEPHLPQKLTHLVSLLLRMNVR